MSWDEIRRAQEDHDDDDFFESLQDAWEEVTTLPVTVTVMGAKITWHSSNLPPWATATGLPDGLESLFTTTTTTRAASSAATNIALTASTIVHGPATLQTSITRPPTVPSPDPVSISAPGTATNTASASASTSCTTTSGVDNGAAELSPTKGGGYGNNGGVTKPPDSSHREPAGPPLGVIVASALIPAVVIALAAFAIFLLLRRRKQRGDARNAPSEEMKLRLNEDFASSGPLEQGPPPPPPPAPAPRPQTPPPRTVTPIQPPPPVIISGINPAGNSAYFTGIDTSEALSVRTNSVRSGPGRAGFMMDGEFHEEPPPPYRPRSVPPLSRDGSTRTNSRADCPVNPFADPSDDEDDESIRSGAAVDPYSRRTDDHLSIVSDLSYQMEPAAVHQAV